ncbi:MAG: hypothetical protein R2844_05875 [Caldilineales bacterium]
MLALSCIQVGERLVHQEDPRIAHQAAGDGYLLALPVRQGAGEFAEKICEIDTENCCGLADVFGRLGLALAQPEVEGEILAHLPVRVERIVLENHADAAVPRRHTGLILAVEQHPA